MSEGVEGDDERTRCLELTLQWLNLSPTQTGGVEPRSYNCTRSRG